MENKGRVYIIVQNNGYIDKKYINIANHKNMKEYT